MKITDLKIDTRCFGKKMLLVDILPCYVYQNGNRTTEIEGYKYILVLPEMSFEKIAVKILGAMRLDKPTDYVEVSLEGLETSIYFRNGNFEIFSTALNIHAKNAS